MFHSTATARTEIWKAITAGTTGSITVAIMDHGELVYSEAFGMADREKGVAADTDTVFNIGSISKDITVRMLLNHTSGLHGSTFWNSFGYEYNERVFDELLEVLSKSTLKHRPRERAAYCNDGFTLAEMIVEKVSGSSYGDFLAKRIFGQLAMNHTGLGIGRIPECMTPARYYRPDGKSESLEVLSLLASGGLSSTAEDLCRFADLFAESSSLLSEQSRLEILKRQPSEFEGKLLGDCWPFGLGWDYADITPYTENLHLYGKSGGTGQYASMLYTIPSQRISVAMIASGPTSPANAIALRILSACLAEKGLIAEAEQAVQTRIKPQPIPPEFTDYSGYYGNCADGTSLLRVALDSDKGELSMYLVDGGDESLVLSAVYNEGFFHSGGIRYYFASVDGNVYLLNHSNYNYLIAEKLQPNP